MVCCVSNLSEAFAVSVAVAIGIAVVGLESQYHQGVH